MVYLCYPILIFLLFWQAKPCKKGTWNEDFLSLSQTKALQGFSAICIMLHHIALKTCAHYLPKEYIRHGLDPFVTVGILFVGLFFFFSGYGLYKSYHTKENYLDGFLSRRVLPIFVITLIIEILYMVARHLKGHDVIAFPWPFTMGGLPMSNSYGWYAYCILLFYLIFYFSFKKCKSEKRALTLIGILILLYIIACDYWIYGDFWYNTAALFFVGILFSVKEETIVRFFKKNYLLLTFVSAVFSVVFLVLGNYFKRYPENFEYMPYGLYRWGMILLQLLAAFFFVWFTLLIQMKLQIGNKVLTSLGSITLEFYLIHGLFVQGLGYSFFLEHTGPVFYIKNVFLMTLIVLILSLICAKLLSMLKKLATFYVIKVKDILALAFVKHLKRDLIIIGVILAILIVRYIMINADRKQNSQHYLDEYIAQQNIQYLTIHGDKMAAYVTGEGDHVIVLLPGVNNFAPIATMKPLANMLATDHKVVIFDFFGSGFSDDTDVPRTIENFTEEIYTGLQLLNIEGPYILMPHEISGIYALDFANTYPEETEAIIGMDAYTSATRKGLVAGNGAYDRAYERFTAKQYKQDYRFAQLLYVTGCKDMFYFLYDSVFTNNTHYQEERIVMENLFVERYFSANKIEELINFCDNSKQVEKTPLSPDLPVYHILGYYTNEFNLIGDFDWKKSHTDTFTNPSIQKTNVIYGDPYFIYYNAKIASQTAKGYIKKELK